MTTDWGFVCSIDYQNMAVASKEQRLAALALTNMNSTETKTELAHKTFDCDCPCDVCDPSTGKHCGKPPCDITAETIELNTLRERLEAVEKANGELVDILKLVECRDDGQVVWEHFRGVIDDWEQSQKFIKATAEAMKGEG